MYVLFNGNLERCFDPESENRFAKFKKFEILADSRSNMARIDAKLCQNEFQTISDVSFFDTPAKDGEAFGSNILFSANLAWFGGSHGRTDVKISFRVKFCSR